MRYLRYALTSPRVLLIGASILLTTMLTVAPRANSHVAGVNVTTPVTRRLGSLTPAVGTRAEAGVPLSPPLTRAIGSLLITVRQNGFEPSEIAHPSGPVFLVVQNRSGFHNLQLRLDPKEGNRLYDVAVPRSHFDWVQVVDLQRGDYTLTDAYHPAWSCKIEVN